MATTSLITGRFVLPNNVAPVDAVARFTLSGYDTDTLGDVVSNIERSYALLPNGDMPAGAVLWRNTSGLRGTFYRIGLTVTLADPFGGMSQRVTLDMGAVQVGAAASYTVKQLLDNPVPAVPGFNVNLDPALYAALLASNAAALVASTTAQTASAAALSSAIAAGALIYPTAAAGIAAVALNAVFYVPLTPAGGLDIRQKTGASTSVSIGQFLPPVQTTSDVTAGRLLTTGAGPAQAFRRGNIVGTVSHTAGVPTGAVVERGANANGEFTRWADGTQICWNDFITAALAVTVARGALFTNTAIPVPTFPAAFSIAPSVQIRGGFANNADGWVTINGSPTATALTNGAIRAYSSISLTDDFRFGYTAIGRWF